MMKLKLINPLELPQMGDVDLGEVKKKFGDKLCQKKVVRYKIAYLF